MMVKCMKYNICFQFEDYQLSAEGDFPAQTERERKEMLYRKSIELLDKGQVRRDFKIKFNENIIHKPKYVACIYIKLPFCQARAIALCLNCVFLCLVMGKCNSYL